MEKMLYLCDYFRVVGNLSSTLSSNSEKIE